MDTDQLAEIGRKLNEVGVNESASCFAVSLHSKFAGDGSAASTSVSFGDIRAASIDSHWRCAKRFPQEDEGREMFVVGQDSDQALEKVHRERRDAVDGHSGAELRARYDSQREHDVDRVDHVQCEWKR